jgi:signal peptidase II
VRRACRTLPRRALSRAFLHRPTGLAEHIINTPDLPRNPPVTVAPRRRRRIGVLVSMALLAYLIDLGSKIVVVARLENHAPVALIGDWLSIQPTRNSGAAFSMGQAMTVVFTVIAAIVVAVICRVAHKLHSVSWALALGMLLGGALGNLTDRVLRSPGVFRGAVVDFISVKYYAVFNSPTRRSCAAASSSSC